MSNKTKRRLKDNLTGKLVGGTIGGLALGYAARGRLKSSLMGEAKRLAKIDAFHSSGWGHGVANASTADKAGVALGGAFGGIVGARTGSRIQDKLKEKTSMLYKEAKAGAVKKYLRILAGKEAHSGKSMKELAKLEKHHAAKGRLKVDKAREARSDLTAVRDRPFSFPAKDYARDLRAARKKVARTRASADRTANSENRIHWRKKITEGQTKATRRSTALLVGASALGAKKLHSVVKSRKAAKSALEKKVAASTAVSGAGLAAVQPLGNT